MSQPIMCTINGIILILISCYLIRLSKSELIQTSSTSQYADRPIQCNNNETCTIICDDFFGCQRAQIECPQNHECNIECTGWQACEGAQFNCPQNQPCNIQCIGMSTCANSIMQCPIDQPCDVTCDQDSACLSSVINATSASSFNLRECRTGNNVCVAMSLYFPSSSRANITGDNSLSAGSTAPLQFYAINGWSDVNVVDYIGDYTYQNGTMHCGDAFEYQCQFASDAFECADTSHICQNLPSSETSTANPTTTNPSTSPTLNPSTQPSSVPSVAPSMFPTNMPSVSPTQQCKPSVSLHGISIYSSTNLNLNGIVDLYAQIIFESGCTFHYDLFWNVAVTKLYSDDVDPIETDDDKLNGLRLYLDDSINEQMLSIDAGFYLQSGMLYTISVNVQSESGNMVTTHELMFDYDPIKCKVANNGIFLDNVDPETDLQNFIIELDGQLLTYDPNKYDFSNDHLAWEWECMDVHGMPCNYLLDSDSNSVVYSDFGSFEFDYLSFYSFTFTMSVIDSDNVFRHVCVDSVQIKFNTSNNETDRISEKLFVVSLTAIQTEINTDHRLQLMGDIMNYDQIALLNEGFLEYQWVELNNLLSDEDIKTYKETSDNSSNLILKENVLEIGQIYSFQLAVSHYSDASKQRRIGYGISTPITIRTLAKPHISAPITIVPECNAKYDSIYDLFAQTHTLSLSADSAHPPLSYEFGYYFEDKENIYFDSSMLSESCLSNIYLPIGDFSIFGHVFDAKSSMVSESISCSIEIESYSECVDSFAELIEPFVDNEQLILERANIYMQYLSEYDGEDMTCIEQSLDAILTAIIENILTAEDALCFSTYSVALSQTMSLWIDLMISNTKPVKFLKNKDRLLQMQSLLFAALDSCLYITNIFSVEELTVSPESIITKIPKIYYRNEDITPYVSPIVTNPHYHPLLYSLASSMIDMFGYLNTVKQSNDLYQLLSKALYVSELIRVSLSIPGENRFTEFNGVSIYSVRVNNENINVSVSNISVLIPKDVTNNGKDNIPQRKFNAVDILVVGINTANTNNVSINGVPASNCEMIEGELSENSISITVLSDTTDIHNLPSNISFTFECDEEIGCDETFECVWYNEEENVWQNDGCFTVIDFEKNEIRCSCSHLTTFATIHNIHSSECENEYLKEWLISTEWDYINMAVALIFLLIFGHTIFVIFPFFRVIKNFSWKSHRAVLAGLLIGITAFLYVLVCIQAYVTKYNFTMLNIKIYSFLLLLPQITMFFLFSMVFYSWFTIAHSFMANVNDMIERLRKILCIFNLFIVCFFLIYYFVSFGVGTEVIFKIGAYLWSTMLAISTTVITVYSFIVGKQLYRAAKISQTQNFAKHDWQNVRRLLITNSFITLYFIFTCLSCIYLSIDSEYQSVAYSVIHSVIDALCLLCVYWMYRRSLLHLISSIHEQHIADNLRVRRGKTVSSTAGNFSPHSADSEKKSVSLPPANATMIRVTSESVYSNSGNKSPKYTYSQECASPISPSPSAGAPTDTAHTDTYKKYATDKISEEQSHEMEGAHDGVVIIELSAVPTIIPPMLKNSSITEYEPEKVFQLKHRSFNVPDMVKDCPIPEVEHVPQMKDRVANTEK